MGWVGLVGAVVADGFHRAAIHGLLALFLLLLVLRLFCDEGVAPVVIPSEAGWCCLAAEITVDALFIHKKFACSVFLVFVFDFSHVEISSAPTIYTMCTRVSSELCQLRRQINEPASCCAT